MRIHVDQAALLPDLVEMLLARVDVVATRVSDNDIEVSLLGSQTPPYARQELEQRLWQWRVRHPGALAEIVDEPHTDP